MRRPFVVGNWKMNTDRDGAVALARAVASNAQDATAEVVVCPPFPWIVSIAESVDRNTLRIGAQDCSQNDDGAFTGDVSAAMLSTWCDLVLVGHSERRTIHGETDETVSAKLRAALDHDLHAVLCVGEQMQDRKAGKAASVVTSQLDSAFALSGGSGASGTVTIAYEPVWAIGTDAAATPGDALEMANVIRAWLRDQDPATADTTRILYGGSVSDRNASDLMAVDQIDGLLVGSASLDAAIFGRIIAAVSGS